MANHYATNPNESDSLSAPFSGFNSINKILSSSLVVGELIVEDVEELMVALLKVFFHICSLQKT